LEHCDTCRERVASLSGDSFPGRMHAAAGHGATPLPDKHVGELRERSPTEPGRSSVPGLPPELVNHSQYEVVKELGRGGMGVVYLARNRHMDRLEVLKVMGQELLAQEGARQRFEREIKSAARLNHPNVVAAHSVLPLENLLVFAMEYVEGQDLAEVVKSRGPLPVANACYYTYQAALGLEHARDKGMVHRDIKPQNLILARDRKKHILKILDFGLAKATSEKGGRHDLTGEGKMLGTPLYMAPEQIDDAASADIRADVYSLGCTLYFLLTGNTPFGGTSLLAILHAHHSKEAASLSEVRPEVPPALAAVVRKMMAKDPAQRYQTPGEVAQALVPFVKAASPTASGQIPVAGARSAEVWKSLDQPAAAPPAAEPAPRWRRPTGVVVAVSLAGLAAAVLAGTVVFWQTRHGLVKIESDDPNVAVVFDKTGPTVQGAGKEPIPLGVGEHGVHVKLGDLEFETQKFKLTKGGTVTLKVELLPGKIQVTADGRVIGAKERRLAAAKGPGPGEESLPKTFTNSVGMEFVLVPKGKSWLGGGGGHPGDKEVTIARDFYLGKYEVTQEEWEKVTGLNPSWASRTGGGKDAVKDIVDAELKRFPVETVSLNDARAFVERLNKQEQDAGWVYRLPGELEWEYACRGGPLADKFESAYDFYFDEPTNQLAPGQANFAPGPRRPCKTGSYRPNRLGLYDMHGNVWEFCLSAEKDANGALLPVRRGGCFNDGWPGPFAGARASAASNLDGRHLSGGLRVARVPAGKEVVETTDMAPGTGAVGSQPNVAPTAAKISRRPFLVRGDWKIENDELVQPTLAAGDENPLLVFGAETLSNYVLTLDVKKTGGRDALGVFFHWLGPGHWRIFCLAGNGGMDFAHSYNGKWSREDGNWKWQRYASNQWYTLKVETRGDTFRGYLDGVLQFEQTDPRFTHGRICLETFNAAARFRRIKVSDLQGSVLFEGLPELPPAGSDTTPKANNGNNPRVLTAGESAAKSAQKQSAERLKTDVIATNSLGMKLALIPPGEFQMGSPEIERDRRRDEQQHRVRITKPFYLGVYAVTQNEFERVLGRNPSVFSNGGGPAEAATGVDTRQYPVENISWYDAVEFCNKLSEKEGRKPYYRIADIDRHPEGWIKGAKVSVEGGGGYRLPTEAQWEYACRAGTTTAFNFGAENNGAECNCNGKAPYGTGEQGPALGRPTPVGSYRPNAFGLYDVHGNAWEWCWDVYAEGYYKNSPEADPAGPPEGRPRVHRGGSWFDTAWFSRSAYRGSGAPPARFNRLGLRVARNPEIAGTPEEEVDRRAARAVLSLGGSVTIRVDGQVRGIGQGQGLPDDAFSLTRIDLHDKSQLTDADLEPLEGVANLTGFGLSKAPKVTDSIIAHLRNSTDLESFWFENSGVADAGLEHLERFTKLKSLGLRNTHVTNAGLAHVARLQHLEHLALGGSRITGAGLVHLRGLNQLAILWLENNKIDDRGLAHLEGLSNLKNLILFGTKVTDNGLPHLKGLSKLEYLDLSGLAVTDAGLARLTALSSLNTLWLGGTRLTDVGAVHLSRLTGLQNLGIQGALITDAGLLHLGKLVDLKKLLLNNTKITAAGVQEFRKRLPACQVLGAPGAP
jgi:formylglycine-generating enzyme required for sulfatase activity